jgi:hypothetical protein
MTIRILNMGLLCAAIGVAAPSIARAACAGPSSEILWTYPDETTPSVPPDAVFWAVAHRGDISVEVDGIALAPRERDGLGRYQFAPGEALTEGEHELVVWTDTPSDTEDAANERHVRFNVVAGPASSGDVVVSSVTVYPFTPGASGLISPPEDEYDRECTDLAVPLEWSCNDYIPYSLARVAYASEGAPIAYLVQGNILVPPGCASFWTGGAVDTDPAAFRAAAILPTGLGEEHGFDGTIEERSLQDSYPERFQDRQSAMCSLPTGGRPPGGVAGMTLLIAATCACAARRSKR